MRDTSRTHNMPPVKFTYWSGEYEAPEDRDEPSDDDIEAERNLQAQAGEDDYHCNLDAERGEST
jgi:hypothetical protein